MSAPAEDRQAYGGCFGPESVYVKLVAGDGHEFIIERDYTLVSRTIKNMLGGPLCVSENESNDVNLKHLSSFVVSKVCQYFEYNAWYPERDYPLEPNMALGLIEAANFLDC